MSEITIIIPTLNRPEILEGTLESLEEAEFGVEYEVMVVDDSEGEETREVCEKFDLEYVRSDESKNLPYARNYALDKIDTRYVAFVDDDVRFYDSWLKGLINGFEKFEADAVGGPIIEDGAEEKIRSKEKQNIVTEKGMITDKSTRWIPPEPVESDTFRGANMAFRKEALEEIGGFDDGYIGSSFREDTDICVRLKKNGFKLLYSPDCKLKHLMAEEGGCRDKSKRFWYSLGYNQRRFVEENFSDHLSYHLIKFLFTWGYAPYSISKLLLSSAKNFELGRLLYLRGILKR